MRSLTFFYYKIILCYITRQIDLIYYIWGGLLLFVILMSLPKGPKRPNGWAAPDNLICFCGFLSFWVIEFWFFVGSIRFVFDDLWLMGLKLWVCWSFDIWVWVFDLWVGWVSLWFVEKNWLPCTTPVEKNRIAVGWKTNLCAIVLILGKPIPTVQWKFWAKSEPIELCTPPITMLLGRQPRLQISNPQSMTLAIFYLFAIHDPWTSSQLGTLGLFLYDPGDPNPSTSSLSGPLLMLMDKFLLFSLLLCDFVSTDLSFFTQKNHKMLSLMHS